MLMILCMHLHVESLSSKRMVDGALTFYFNDTIYVMSPCPWLPCSCVWSQFRHVWQAHMTRGQDSCMALMGAAVRWIYWIYSYIYFYSLDVFCACGATYTPILQEGLGKRSSSEHLNLSEKLGNLPLQWEAQKIRHMQISALHRGSAMTALLHLTDSYNTAGSGSKMLRCPTLASWHNVLLP